jgi:hypothetical protein
VYGGPAGSRSIACPGHKPIPTEFCLLLLLLAAWRLAPRSAAPPLRRLPLLSMSAPLPTYEQTRECDVRALVACGFDADDARRALADAEGAVSRPVDEAAVMLLSATKCSCIRAHSSAKEARAQRMW